MIASSSEAAILSRVIEPQDASWPPQAAQALLALALPVEDQERADHLAAKAQQGSLSDAEPTELESYHHVGRLLELLKSKARRSLKETERS